MLQPGKYWIGDLCYVMHDEWKEVCKLMFPNKNYGAVNGEFTLKTGVQFAINVTKYGDGTYTDQFGNEYGVDSGTIGCIAIDDINQNNKQNDLELGHIVEFKQPFTLEYQDGVIIIGHIYIDTDPDDDSNDDLDDDSNDDTDGDI